MRKLSLVLWSAICLLSVVFSVGCTSGEKPTEKCDHKFDQGVFISSPTCTEDGSTRFTCEKCGEEVIKTVSAKGHKYEGSTLTPATCTEDRESLMKGSFCNNT
ncbi:MAG: hypothetical protein MJ072_00665 [Clostridia bacterium]|nr:hypothetical protein [Clostridia bacterium]